MKAINAIVDKMGGGNVAVGFMEGALYPDGTPVAAAAFWAEYGKPNQPPRPFFRTMIAKESPGWGAKIARQAKGTNYDGPRVLALMGDDIGGALIESIRSPDWAPLSPVTLMLRKMVGNKPENITGAMVGEAAAKVAAGEEGATGTQAKPLEWTGTMVRAVHYQVNDGEQVPVLKGQ